MFNSVTNLFSTNGTATISSGFSISPPPTYSQPANDSDLLSTWLILKSFLSDKDTDYSSSVDFGLPLPTPKASPIETTRPVLYTPTIQGDNVSYPKTDSKAFDAYKAAIDEAKTFLRQVNEQEIQQNGFNQGFKDAVKLVEDGKRAQNSTSLAFWDRLQVQLKEYQNIGSESNLTNAKLGDLIVKLEDSIANKTEDTETLKQLLSTMSTAITLRNVTNAQAQAYNGIALEWMHNLS